MSSLNQGPQTCLKTYAKLNVAEEGDEGHRLCGHIGARIDGSPIGLGDGVLEEEDDAAGQELIRALWQVEGSSTCRIRIPTLQNRQRLYISLSLLEI